MKIINDFQPIKYSQPSEVGQPQVKNYSLRFKKKKKVRHSGKMRDQGPNPGNRESECHLALR